jgi:hypothetical protein
VVQLQRGDNHPFARLVTINANNRQRAAKEPDSRRNGSLSGDDNVGGVYDEQRERSQSEYPTHDT